MLPPQVELIPLRSAVRSDTPTVLDVLVRITPPRPEVHFLRPPINLALVLDHSGSMADGNKIDYARQAAAYAVEQLLPTDRISVTIFDHEVETIARNAPVVAKELLVRQIRAIQPDGSTALHAGWAEGAEQAAGDLLADGLNRVLLLSDGLANVGLTDPNAIVGEVKAVVNRGVSTTTMGVGDDYNEDLMEAMARAGDGNYYFIESPRQLPDIFQTELQGLMATAGQRVSLGLEPQGSVTVSEVLNDFERNSNDRLMLPNLVVGMPIHVVVRLNVPPWTAGGELCCIRLAWDEPKGGARRTLRSSLELPSVAGSAWDALAADPAVQEQVALLMAARAKKEAIHALDRGDLAGTRRWIDQAHVLACCAAPDSAAIAKELEEIAQVDAELAQGDLRKFRKRAAFQHYRRGRGHSS